MKLLNPKYYPLTTVPDKKTQDLLQATINFFESKGKYRMKEDDHNKVWYTDFLTFIKESQIFAEFLTPPQYGSSTSRWDTHRNNLLSEILGFYGLSYWYTWQVSILGLGPIWMSKNEKIKKLTATYLQEGGIFGFGLSEKEHGADIYSTEMKLLRNDSGDYTAIGKKYYIGNGNKAALLSIFGKLANEPISDSKYGEYVFFPVSTSHAKYEVVKNIVDSQMFVAEYRLNHYPVPKEDILAKGREAWDMALNTVNIGKFNLGWASIGICTHAFYEAINHATHRILYGHPVSNFPHIQQYFIEAYCRLMAMKLFASRATDYMRSASNEDRRYLLFNPLVKMWVTLQGEKVIDLLWDIIAAKGYEKDTYFENATRDIRMLPKLEGTVHVNMALVLKFMQNYFFHPDEDLPIIPHNINATHDEFLFNQPPAKGLGEITFHAYQKVFDQANLPNILIFKEQLQLFREFILKFPPTKQQASNFDFLLNLGSMFTQIVYGQLIIEMITLDTQDQLLLNQIFNVLIRDFSKYAASLASHTLVETKQAEALKAMLSAPNWDANEYNTFWENNVVNLKDLYSMNK